MHLEEIGPGPIHFVHERQAWHAVLVGLTPDGFGLGLHTTHGAIHHAGAIKHPHRTLDLDREVDVSRGVNNVDPVLGARRIHSFPETGRRSRRDRDPTFLFLFHPVHRGGAIVDFTDLVVHPGVEQDAFSSRRLAGVDMRRNADVAVALDRSLAGHGSNSLVAVEGDKKMRRNISGTGQVGGSGFRQGRSAAATASTPLISLEDLRSGSGRTPCWPQPSDEPHRAS